MALLPLVSSDDGYKHCEGVIRGWAASSTGRDKDGDKLSLKDLLFFLHIPRTGGRTYFHWYGRRTKQQFGSPLSKACPVILLTLHILAAS